MRRNKIIAVSALLTLAISSVFFHYFSSSSHIQVVGHLNPNDREKILKLVRQELRFHILPSLELENVFYPRYVIQSVGDYEAQHILWIDVKMDGSVDVFAGVSKDIIRSEGHLVSLQKNPNWKITGYAYWASSNVAPADIHVPPSPRSN